MNELGQWMNTEHIENYISINFLFPFCSFVCFSMCNTCDCTLQTAHCTCFRLTWLHQCYTPCRTIWFPFYVIRPIQWVHFGKVITWYCCLIGLFDELKRYVIIIGFGMCSIYSSCWATSCWSLFILHFNLSCSGDNRFWIFMFCSLSTFGFMIFISILHTCIPITINKHLSFMINPKYTWSFWLLSLSLSLES